MCVAGNHRFGIIRGMKKGTKKEISTDDLATMVLKGMNELKTDLQMEMRDGFKKVDDRLGKVEDRLDGVENRLEIVENSLVKIRGDINNTNDRFVPYHKFDALATRVTNIENKGKVKVRK